MNRFFATSALCVALSATFVAGSASAQTTDPGVTPAPLAPQVEAAPPPAPAVAATGEWVETANGMVWVPAGTQAVAIASTPYAYLYTPTYGWTWYASPWGAGPYVRGAWISHPWPYGFHAWVNRGGSWGWYHAGRVPYHVGHVGGPGSGHVMGHSNVGHPGAGYGGRRGGPSHGGGFHGGRGGGGFHGGGGHGGGGHGGGGRR